MAGVEPRGNIHSGGNRFSPRDGNQNDTGRGRNVEINREGTVMGGHEKNTDQNVDTTLQNVPAINGSANDHQRDVIGNKDDDESGSSIFAKAHALHEHAHSKQRVYPTLANGVTVTGAAGAWALGNFAVIIPANAINAPFDIHHVNVSAYNANDTFELVFYAGADGAEVEIGRTRFTRTTNVGTPPHIPMMTVINPANSQIKAKIASQNGTSNTATISVLLHTY